MRRGLTPALQKLAETCGACGQMSIYRRVAVVFPIERDLRYRILGRHAVEEGTGYTINLSRYEVLFATTEQLIPGHLLELNISWPAQLNDSTSLQLIVRGRIVLYEPGRAAIDIERHSFQPLQARFQAALGAAT